MVNSQINIKLISIFSTNKTELYQKCVKLRCDFDSLSLFDIQMSSDLPKMWDGIKNKSECGEFPNQIINS